MEKACFLHPVPAPLPISGNTPAWLPPLRRMAYPLRSVPEKDRPQPGGAPPAGCPAGQPYQGACHEQRVRLRPCIQHRPERRAPASVPATAGRPQAQDLHRPDVGQGLPPSPVRRPAGTAPARRPALRHEYRSSGPQLWGIQRQWRLLTQERHVDILVLDMPLLDTRRTGTCWGPSLPTSCCRCSRSWPRTSGKTSGDARPKASPLHGCGAFAWDGNQGPCLPIFPKCTNCGKREKSPLSKPRNSAAWHGQHSVTVQNP